MTLLEALQSTTEYENDNLLAKILIDHDLTSTDIYEKADREDIDKCAAGVFFFLAGHPEFKEGSKLIKYDGNQLRSMAQKLLSKYDAEDATIDGTSLW
jgi:hypothetical protein